MMIISLIAAIDKNRAIGNENKMLWHLPADFAWFKAHTVNKPVIMGRKTFESIGRPLPNRLNIVLSQQPISIEGVEVFGSIEAALERLNGYPELMVIGGANIYNQFLPIANQLIITYVDATFTADAFFPAYDLNEWQPSESQFYAADEKNAYDMTFKIYQKA